MFDTPVLFLVFNRPDLTRQVFEKIKEIKPAKLFVAADGPRLEIAGEKLLCEETRNLVLNNISWNCEVTTLLRDENVGCRLAVSEAITWYFEQVEEGIILEDDCLPDHSFFYFCKTLLEKFRDDDNIFHISGNNFQFSEIGTGSYYLSKIPHVWGWASWKRAWKNYDVDLKRLDGKKDAAFFNNKEIDLFWKNIFIKTRNKEIDTWDYQWGFTLLHYNKYAILPQYNLVKNIGFDKRSNRTQSKFDNLANLKTYPLYTITHPAELHYESYPDILFHRLFGMQHLLYTERLSGKKSLQVLLNKLSYMVLKKKWFEI